MNRPYTMMLVAVSLDGKISPLRRPGQKNPVGPSLIPPEIMSFHNSKRVADGIMVGLNCILLDDSRLTLREGAGDKQPTRIVLDGLAEISPDARVLNGDAPTIVVVSTDAPAEKIDAFKAKGAEIIVSGQGKFVDLPPLMEELHDRWGIERLIVEGGGTVHRSMIADNLYDELHLIICPFVIGGKDAITPVERGSFWPDDTIPEYELARAEKMGDYLYVVYKSKALQ